MSSPLSYEPIRARIAEAFDEDHETITDVCIIVAAIAHGQQHTLLRAYGPGLIAEAQRLFSSEIADVHDISEALAAHYRAAGLAAEAIDANVNAQLQREFFRVGPDALGLTC